MIYTNSHRVRVYKIYRHSGTDEYYPVIRSEAGVHGSLSEVIAPYQIFIRVGDAGVSRWGDVFLSPDGMVCLCSSRLYPVGSDGLPSQD